MLRAREEEEDQEEGEQQQQQPVKTKTMMSYAEKAKSGLKVIHKKKGVEECERFEATFEGEEEEEEEEEQRRRREEKKALAGSTVFCTIHVTHEATQKSPHPSI